MSEESGKATGEVTLNLADATIPFKDLVKAANDGVGLSVKNEKGEVIGTVIAFWVDEKREEIYWKADLSFKPQEKEG